ncbi:triose-phosphate isomerase [Candidatus Woesearchaeota archaeon]|jgi:triosephosphate isomerase (TIM)|nr:triose-phosphate isomerase [Candidatus Woesearchaeota archaeon]MBT3537775.1 triose-phosphate isomerase [Candidatus Woesearchaeota archaeon]MBT4697906.1 triose-phosphate isomerase [Candidatus Woesearchaeota archaeon]MBT4717269.1 triose-phosphate isomerase [Candidatus Woesearchaeota archaeon]MBT7105444.1 triose-phosphate isomerase [Candidatus Woesearchaeota archaeon]
MLVINFKTYASATGQKAVDLARICDKVAHEVKVPILIAVQNVDLFRVARQVSIPVLAQHIDPVVYGSHTGHDLAEAILENGAYGVLIDHSEDRVSLDNIKQSIDRAKSVGLLTIVCVDTPKKASQVSKFSPDYIAIEPPELIGGDISVSTAKPEIISDTVAVVNNVPVLCGAGVKSKDDVSKSKELGSKGILIASGVTKANNPEKVIRELVKGFL